MNNLTYKWVCTCEGCPEQYDIYLEDKLIAYFRLRWGSFYVVPYNEYGSVQNITICSGTYGDGCMTGSIDYNDKERFKREIEDKITKYLLEHSFNNNSEIKNWNFD